ncbi:hypothetical protein V8E51_007188 [Hyaloscypha variabilis]
MTISTSTTIAVMSPLYLNITTSTPDPFGIANVSGVYGPGTWAAWFLTGVAAWWRIIRHSEEKIDANTWAFIFGTNWAAVDVFRAIHSIGSISSPENEAELKTNLGTFGAAFTVVFWGSFHAFSQLVATLAVFKYSDCLGKRLWTLITGLILPSIALLASAYLFHPLQNYQAASELLPVLYWRGMDNSLHYVLFYIASLTSVVLFPIIILWIKHCNPDPHWQYRTSSFDFGLSPEDRDIICLGVVYLVVSVATFITILIFHPEIFIFYHPMLLCLIITVLLAFNVPYVFFFVWILIYTVGSAIYVWKGYLCRNPKTWGSESCFFMPCSPQSIKDEDQMNALLAGLFLFVGLEGVPLVLKYLRRRYRETGFLFRWSRGH